MIQGSFHWPKTDISSDVSRKAVRQLIIEQIFAAESGHPGGSLSLVEVLAAIFDGNFNQDVSKPENPTRDRLILSKGHGVPALYTYMSMLGYFDAQELKHLRRYGHFLQGHPDKTKNKWMEASTGSLGQGLSVALGTAIGLGMDFKNRKIARLPRVYCILGDGEMQEGQVWEALLAGGKFLPSNLIAILDYNGGQIDGPVEKVMNLEPITDKIKAFNWNVVVADGHNVKDLQKLFAEISGKTSQENAKPTFVVAKTVKGKGVSFMEHPTKFHGAAPTKEQLEQSLQEIWSGHQSPYPYGSILAGKV